MRRRTPRRCRTPPLQAPPPPGAACAAGGNSCVRFTGKNVVSSSKQPIDSSARTLPLPISTPLLRRRLLLRDRSSVVPLFASTSCGDRAGRAHIDRWPRDRQAPPKERFGLDLKFHSLNVFVLNSELLKMSQAIGWLAYGGS